LHACSCSCPQHEPAISNKRIGLKQDVGWQEQLVAKVTKLQIRLGDYCLVTNSFLTDLKLLRHLFSNSRTSNFCVLCESDMPSINLTEIKPLSSYFAPLTHTHIWHTFEESEIILIRSTHV